MADDGNLLADKDPVRWTVRGKTPIFIPTKRIEEDGGNRIVERTRFDRPGAKLDDTGRKARRWTITTTIANPMKETGIPYVDMYPGLVDEIIVAFDVHEVGDLYLPTVGINVRVRAETYRRVEESDKRNAAGLMLVFVEDNEDDVTAASFAKPAARSTAEYFSKAAAIEALYSGAYSAELAELPDDGAALEAAARQPGGNLLDVATAAETIVGKARYVEEIFSGGRGAVGREIGSLLGGAESDTALRALRDLSDLAYRAVEEAASAKPKIIPTTFFTDTSIIAIANTLGQSVEELIEINPRLPDPFRIPAGRIVYVFEAHR